MGQRIYALGSYRQKAPTFPAILWRPPFSMLKLIPWRSTQKSQKKSQRHGHQKSGIEKGRVGRLASLSLSSPPGHDPICACAAKVLDPFIILMGGIKKLCTTCVFFDSIANVCAQFEH